MKYGVTQSIFLNGHFADNHLWGIWMVQNLINNLYRYISKLYIAAFWPKSNIVTG